MHSYFKNHTLAAGALILTLTGIASRILGFFYRIFLSRTIGAEGLGVYQMVFPIYGICFSICAGSIQTAISRFTAADRDRAGRTLLAGFIISFSLALGLAAVIIRFSGFLASHVLMEPRCAPLLPAMALAIPCTSVHACLCGWYYGKEKVQVPALSQMVEQCIRIFTVFLIARIWEEQGRPVTVLAAVAGLVAGEAGSALFTLLSFLLFGNRKKDGPSVSGRPAPSSILTAAAPLLAMALPLMGNRLVMNLLQSLEAILIPVRLELSGLSRSQALSVYGVLTGMALPFVMFPSAIINSLAVVLLPSVARHQSLGNRSGILKNIALSFRYSSYMGILCIGIFTSFGDSLGLQVFKSAEAGSFISILAWLCPFLYLSTTMGSVLNGLGKTSVTFLHNLVSLLVRLAFVFFGIPPGRDPGLPLGYAGRRAGPLPPSSVLLKKAGPVCSQRLGSDRKALVLPGVSPGDLLPVPGSAAPSRQPASLFRHRPPDRAGLHRISSIFAAVPQKAGSLVKFHGHIKAPIVFHDLFYHALAAF